MRRIKRSFGYAVDGLKHAFRIEKNLRLFLPVFILVLILAGVVHILVWEWLALIIAGAAFTATELINTAIERLADVLDHERKLQGRGFHAGMKACKDVAAGASLVMFAALVVVIVMVFWPYIMLSF